MFSRIVFFLTCLYLSTVLIKDVKSHALSDAYLEILEELLDEYLVDDEDLSSFDFNDLGLKDPVIFENKTYDLSELEVTGLSGLITLHQFKMKGFTDFTIKDAYDHEDPVDGHELASYKILFPLITYNIDFTAEVNFFGIPFCSKIQMKMDLDNYDINYNSLTTMNAAAMLYNIKQNMKISVQSESC